MPRPNPCSTRPGISAHADAAAPSDRLDLRPQVAGSVRTPWGNVLPLRDRPAWSALRAHHDEVSTAHLRDLFAADPGRTERMSADAVGLHLDFSKHRIVDETVRLLLQLAEESGLRERIDAMFRGDRINVSEDRSVLHVALRMPRDASLVVDGTDVVAQVHEVLDRMAAFAERVRVGRVDGPHRSAHPQRGQHRHRRVRLGPVMAYEALRFYSDRD